MSRIGELAEAMNQNGSAERLPLLYAVERGLAAEDILVRLVERSDAGSDTYEVRELVEEARKLLGLPERFAPRR